MASPVREAFPFTCLADHMLKVTFATMKAKPVWKGFRIVPGDIPNAGILFVDHERNRRSGHGGNTVTECRNGDIVSFYSNVSGCADAILGHSVAGWSEYRRSTDGGKTWGPAVVLDYSRRMWEGDELFSALVFASITAPDGTLIAILPRFVDRGWRRKWTPVYLLSHDHGQTWSEPRDVDPDAGVDELAVSFDACLVHQNSVFVMFSGGVGGMGPGPYSLYVSVDNGQTFQQRSRLPFDHSNYYGTIAVLDDGRLIAYSYPVKDAGMVRGFNQGDGSERTNEHHLHYTVSADAGRTWSPVQTTYFAKRLRNPQMSDKIGHYYFMHGRSGSHGAAPGNLVLYASRDGINWDEGVYLHTKVFDGGDKYSANEIIGKYDPSMPRRLLIQSSVVYDAHTSRVNERHWWIDHVEGTETDAPRCANLHAAVAEGDIEAVEGFLQTGAPVEERNVDGHTPLALAILGRHLAIARCLVQHGADFNARCKYGFTALHRAIRTEQPDLVAWLLGRGADMSAHELNGTFLPVLGCAAETGNLEIVRMLVERGADPEATDNDDATPVFLAAQYGRQAVAEYLVGLGVQTNRKDVFGRRPADVARVSGKQALADWLKNVVN